MSSGSVACLEYLLSLSLSVLSGLCSNDCPDGVKVTDPFFFIGPVSNVFYSCLHVCIGTLLLVFIVFHSYIFLESICSAFLAGREEEAGIYLLLAKCIVSRKNHLYIQEIKEGDLNK